MNHKTDCCRQNACKLFQQHKNSFPAVFHASTSLFLSIVVVITVIIKIITNIATAIAAPYPHCAPSLLKPRRYNVTAIDSVLCAGPPPVRVYT